MNFLNQRILFMLKQNEVIGLLKAFVAKLSIYYQYLQRVILPFMIRNGISFLFFALKGTLGQTSASFIYSSKIWMVHLPEALDVSVKLTSALPLLAPS